ncbi:PilZ domain-containing protein [Kiloniella sp.]|uniref:PilZ domain-containing protein n=1 Tax=Kiloniella sp. TaxID=1938587 RepID=UPI003A8EB90B
MAKVVAVYNKERRRDHRRAVNLAAKLKGIEALLKGVRVTINDISPGGVGIKGEETDLEEYGDMDVIVDDGEKLDIEGLGLKVGDIVSLEILLKKADPFLIDIEIRRADTDHGKLGARFVKIGNKDFNTLEKIVLGRLR